MYDITINQVNVRGEVDFDVEFTCEEQGCSETLRRPISADEDFVCPNCYKTYEHIDLLPIINKEFDNRFDVIYDNKEDAKELKQKYENNTISDKKYNKKLLKLYKDESWQRPHTSCNYSLSAGLRYMTSEGNINISSSGKCNMTGINSVHEAKNILDEFLHNVNGEITKELEIINYYATSKFNNEVNLQQADKYFRTNNDFTDISYNPNIFPPYTMYIQLDEYNETGEQINCYTQLFTSGAIVIYGSKEEYIQKAILKLHEFIVDNAELVNGMYKFDYCEEKHQEKFEKLREEMMNCDKIMSSI